MTGNQKVSRGFSDHAATPAHSDDRTADAEVAMRTRFLLLAPVLALIAGCSEKIEAQENISEPSKIGEPPEQTDTAAEVSEEQETDLKLRSPVGLD
ncbi:hypothetical protein [Sphingopyxis sp. JAI108]|uniref:hypothetical protein n=1 Tax=Sphingopyxis sp. JAI108 TaxID=2723060 RepID=UPI0015CD98D6|nr:hypothetical protein [Sphingopyxis sp. JAI108]NYF30676.1 hypothetical protein [Sphingopyxis sp. JAI108]